MPTAPEPVQPEAAEAGTETAQLDAQWVESTEYP